MLPPPSPQIAAVLYDYHANLYSDKSASAKDLNYRDNR